HMNALSRREALTVISNSVAALTLCPLPELSAASTPSRRTSMGIVTYALALHQKNNWGGRYQGLTPALALLEESRRFGAAGIMVDLGAKDASQIEELRRRAEQYGMYIEASIMPPKSAEDVARFEEGVRLAKAAGASL